MQKSIVTWLAALLAIVAGYYIALRVFYPGYFAPISAFHVDFFEYASFFNRPITAILRYPRPAAYFAMKLLGFDGLNSVIAGTIALALANVALTAALLQRTLARPIAALPLATALYALLLFAQPSFYTEHRHDLPAVVSYFLALSSLLCWTEFLKQRRALPRYLLAASAFGLCTLFVFCKETYFGSVLCLILALAWSDVPNRKRHLTSCLITAFLEVASFLWNAHLNGPFVNTHAAADNTYRMVFTPVSIASTLWFYLAHLWNPWLLILVAWTIYRMKDRVIAMLFVLAGLAAFGPHALLPNHIFEEYVWVAAPLCFAPFLLLGQDLARLRIPGGVALVLTGLTLLGPWAYVQGYRSEELAYELTQDRIGHNMAASIEQLDSIPRGSRVLVAGLDAVYVPFASESFVTAEFGDRTFWTVLNGPGVQERKANRLTSVAQPTKVKVGDFDYLVAYNSEGAIESLQRVQQLGAVKPDQLVPQLAPLAAAITKQPREGYLKLQAAAVCLDWALWDDAKRYLDDLTALGAPHDANYNLLAARLEKGLREEAAAPAVSQVATLTANPQRIPDADGTGLARTEISWTIQPPRACEIRIGSPDGKLFAMAAASGSSKTDKWVRNGMTFYLQDVSQGKPLTAQHTLASVTIEVPPSSVSR